MSHVRTNSFFFLIVFAITLGASSESKGQTLEDLSVNVSKMIEKGNYKKAIKLYDQMIAIRPDSTWLYVIQATQMCMSGQLEESFKVFDKAYELDPKDPTLYLNRGQCFHTYRYYDKAVQDFNEGIKWADTDTVLVALYCNRGASKMAYMDVKGSLDDNLLALKIDSNNLGLLNNIGMTYGDMKKYEKAEYYLRRVLELDSTFDGGLMNLGFLYSEMKKFEDALEILNTAIRKFPDRAFTYNNRGLVKHRLADSKGAIKDIEQSIKMYSSNSYAFRNLAIVYNDLGQTTKACENCKAAIDLGFTTNYGSEMEKFYKTNCTQ